MALAERAAPPGWPDTLLRGLVLAGAVLAPFNYLIGLSLGDVTIHPLEPWAALLLGATLLLEPRLLVAAAEVPTLLLWTTFAFIVNSTLFATPDEYRARGWFDVLLLAMNLIAFTLTYGHLRRGRPGWATFGRVLFVSSLAASAFMSLRALSVTSGGELAGPDSYVLGLGTVAGTYTAAFTAASMLGATFGPTGRFRLAMLLGVAVHGMAASFALARGPWLALAATFAAGTLFGVARPPRLVGPVRGLARAFVAALVLIAVTVVTAIEDPLVAKLLLPRLLGIANVTTGTGSSRLALFRGLFDDALTSPVFGHGAAAYRRISELLGYQGSISENFLLEVFHAGGAVAAAPLAVASAMIVLRLARPLDATRDGGVALVYLAGVLTLMLGSLTNPAAWNTAFWILVAAGAALAPALREPRPTRDPATAGAAG